MFTLRNKSFHFLFAVAQHENLLKDQDDGFLLVGGKPSKSNSLKFQSSKLEDFGDNFEDWSISNPLGLFDSSRSQVLLMGGYDVKNMELFKAHS